MSGKIGVPVMVVPPEFFSADAPPERRDEGRKFMAAMDEFFREHATEHALVLPVGCGVSFELTETE
jgi:hypothetical protein